MTKLVLFYFGLGIVIAFLRIAWVWPRRDAIALRLLGHKSDVDFERGMWKAMVFVVAVWPMLLPAFVWEVVTDPWTGKP